MIYPRFLKNKSHIGVPAPSSGAYDEPHVKRYANSKQKLEKMGYKITLSKNINRSEKCRSGTAKERAEEVNNMFQNKDIDFIMCAAGGEFLLEILPYIDFEKISFNPKFIQGFSDPTGLLFPITTKLDIATIYGNNFGEYGSEIYDRSVLENLQIINGNIVTQRSYEMYEGERGETVTGLEGYNFTDKVEWKIINENEVNISGRIIGGCIDIITELAGTKYDGTTSFIEKYRDDGIIWYFDNCELSKEELIRTLWKLNELGYFKYTTGIIFGRNGVETSCLEYTMEEALCDSVVGKLGIPVIYDADFSHKGPCFTVINGSIATLECKSGKGKLSMELK